MMYMYELASNRTNASEKEKRGEEEDDDAAAEQIDKRHKVFLIFFFSLTLYRSVNIFFRVLNQ